jgi:hypothetical protein
LAGIEKPLSLHLDFLILYFRLQSVLLRETRRLFSRLVAHHRGPRDAAADRAAITGGEEPGEIRSGLFINQDATAPEVDATTARGKLRNGNLKMLFFEINPFLLEQPWE